MVIVWYAVCSYGGGQGSEAVDDSGQWMILSSVVNVGTDRVGC